MLRRGLAGCAYQLVLGKPVRHWLPVDKAFNEAYDARQASPDPHLTEPLMPAGPSYTVPWQHYFR
jgi:hypothetical protein